MITVTTLVLYRGAANNNCNLKYKIPKHIPIVFHNLSGYVCITSSYDNSERSSRAKDIGVIAENKEKYISFNVKIWIDFQLEMNGKPVTKKIKLRFIDSFRFMLSSLDSLARNLTDDQCKNLRWFYQDQEGIQANTTQGCVSIRVA